MDIPLTLIPGDVYRGRLILDGPAQYASAEKIVDMVKALGASQVWVWASPESPTFPKDWPPNKLDDVSDFMEVQWYGQLRFDAPPGVSTIQFPSRGQNWRMHDYWTHVTGSGVEPPTPPPTLPPPPTDAAGCAALLKQWADQCGEQETPTPECAALMQLWTTHCAEGPDLPKVVPPPPGTDIGDYAGRPPGDLDKWAPAVLIEAFRTVMGTLPTPQALQAIQAVGRLEGYYGWAGKPAHWAGNHNWGAITCKCPCGFESRDGYYVDGKWQPYTTCFARRATNLEGAIHLIEVLVLKRKPVQAVMDSGNLTLFARAMRDTTYFCRTTGKGKDGKPSCQAATDAQKQSDAIHYAKVMDKACATIGTKTGTGQLAFLDGPPPDKPDPHPEITTTWTPPAPYTRAGALAAGSLAVVGTIALIVGSYMRKER